MHLELRDLRLLVQLARGGLLRDVAARLGVSRSAVSHHVASLERRLGIVLHQGGGRPTAAALRLARPAAAALTVHQALTMALRPRAPRGAAGASLKLHDLRLVVALAECGSLSGAASRLCVTASAAGHQLRRLERSLGVLLAQRDGTPLRLTGVGISILTQARAVLAAASRVASPLAHGDAASGGERPLVAST